MVCFAVSHKVLDESISDMSAASCVESLPTNAPRGFIIGVQNTYANVHLIK